MFKEHPKECSIQRYATVIAEKISNQIIKIISKATAQDSSNKIPKVMLTLPVR